jgi:hypothetical protein
MIIKSARELLDIVKTINMSVSDIIKSKKEDVKRYLEADEKYRDDDESLVARFWHEELRKQQIDSKSITGMDLLKRYADGKLTSADVITRARRKVQEENVELRGKKWEKRHEEESDVRKTINT